MAELRPHPFSPSAARWVADEEWHPDQRGWFEDDGHYFLEVPYADPTELQMDILRHGQQVEELEPPALKESIRQELLNALALY